MIVYRRVDDGLSADVSLRLSKIDLEISVSIHRVFADES